MTNDLLAGLQRHGTFIAPFLRPCLPHSAGVVFQKKPSIAAMGGHCFRCTPHKLVLAAC